MAGRAVRGRWDPDHDRGHPRRQRRGAARAGPGSSRRGARRRDHPSEIKSGYGLDVESEARLCRLAAELTDDVTFLGAHLVPPEYEGRADDYVELVCGEMLAACAPYSPLDRRLLRARRVRRRPVARRARRRSRRRPRAARARQPARPRARRAARGRDGRRLGRPLHLPRRRRHRRARRRASTVATFLPGDRLLDPPALPGRAPRDRRRGRGRDRHQLRTRAPATRPRCRSASPSRSATSG